MSLRRSNTISTLVLFIVVSLSTQVSNVICNDDSIYESDFFSPSEAYRTGILGFYPHHQNSAYESDYFTMNFNSFESNNFQSASSAVRAASPECQRDMSKIFTSNTLKIPWAALYMDAWGKPPAGVKRGNYKWFGDFDECLAIPQQPVGRNSSFRPRFCRVGIGLRENKTALGPTIMQFFPALMVGICISSNCNEKDIPSILDPFIESPIVRVVKNLTYCIVEDPPINSYAFTAIYCFSFVALFLVVGLILDLGLRWRRYIRIKTLKDELQRFYPKGHHVESPSSNSDSKIKDEYPLLSQKESLTVAGHFASLFLIFSPLSNFIKLLKLSARPKGQPIDLGSINGIRTLSLFWVILGHIYVFFYPAIDNLAKTSEMTTYFTFQFVLGGLFAVDTFLFLSGFLAYWSMASFMKPVDTKTGKPRTRSMTWFLFSLPYIYLRRYLRLTPAYASLILINLGLWPHLSSGPFYFQQIDAYCAENWWTSLLYVNNFVDTARQCVGWGWYLSVDMQLFLVAPFVVYLFVRWPIFGWLTCGAGLIAQIAVASWLTVTYNLPSSQFAPAGYYTSGNGTELKDYSLYFDKIYIKPYTRMGPYIVGLIACHLVVRHGIAVRRSVMSRSWLAALMWILSFSLMLALIYGQYGVYSGAYVDPNFVDAIYNSLARISWGVALGWLVIACSVGRGGVVQSILSWSLWQIPARLSYVAYLIHPLVMLFFVQTSRRPFHLTDLNVIFTYCGVVVVNFLLSTVLSLAFESPIIGLLHSGSQ